MNDSTWRRGEQKAEQEHFTTIPYIYGGTVGGRPCLRPKCHVVNDPPKKGLPTQVSGETSISIGCVPVHPDTLA